MSWMATYRGHRFDFFNMSKTTLDIEDIAHALSQICRFGGHCREFYSVAQHSVYVSQLCSHDHKLVGLLHDATEAYIGDMVTPLKRLVPDFQQYEASLYHVIAKQFGLPRELPQEVKDADITMLAAEARDLLNADVSTWGLTSAPESIRIEPWPSKLAEKYFLEAFHTIDGEYARALATSFMGGIR